MGAGAGSAGLLHSLFRTKPIDQVVHEDGQGEGGELKRTMGLWQLTLFSVGATLGTGIFFVLGQAVPVAGPAVVLGFVLAGVTALFSALSYAELAGTIPVSGSSYSYTYATMGELVAWVCGWCLLLEYAVSVSAVASSWGGYLNDFFDAAFGFTLPQAISHTPGDEGGVVNLPAVIIIALAMVLLLQGTSESATANTIMVSLKMVVLAFFCVVAFTAFDTGNFSSFAPMGWAGISAAGSKVFFSYIGFDAASTAGEEAKNPKRDLPLAILLSLLIVTVIYVLVGVAAVGAMPWQDFDSDTSLADVLNLATGNASWASLILSFGVVISMGTVVLTVLYGQTRILFAMSRDGLVPKVFERVGRNSVPVANTVIVCAFVALLAAVVPLGQLAEATSIGTLFAFSLVNLGVIVLRRTRPDLPRSFRSPLFPITPIIGVALCVYLMAGLESVTWLVFLIWLAVGMVAYFGYGRRNSKLARARTSD
ncbi:amino acid permease [Actinomadura parmotrematis]|uniref:amino acid permease n=1 Tax=Actinomadura parmotrematis TaxID=2864039 RepID=UPI0027E34EB8|nr:amino acid permease [Actinomadura parmotrematis]